jgi:predicted transposase YbfD/YdcC
MVQRKKVPPLAEYFKDVEDPRIDRKKLYPLIEVILIALLALMSGAEGWEDMQDYGNAKLWWLKRFLPLENGIPGHDVFRRVFCRLIPQQIERCFMAWVHELKMDIKREVIAVDGKTMRGSVGKQAGIKAAHMVSAWATENRLVLAQVKTEDKSNEITAIPELLGMIALKGAIVTIDAMGCQYKIADQIVGAGGDYLFSLKGNQERLEEDVELYFRDIDFECPEAEVQVYTSFEADHGRLERRKHAVTGDVRWLIERHPKWKTIGSIGVIEEKRETGKGGEKVSVERRHYVSSLPADAELLAFAARAHWGIENSLHYILDVAFREDACRISRGFSPQTLGSIRKLAMTLVRSDVESKLSIRKRLKKLAWSDEYFEQLLFHSVFASELIVPELKTQGT